MASFFEMYKDYCSRCVLLVFGCDLVIAYGMSTYRLVPAAELLTRDLVAFRKIMVTRGALRNHGSIDESTKLDIRRIPAYALLYLFSAPTQQFTYLNSYMTHGTQHGTQHAPSPSYFDTPQMANTTHQGFSALPAELRLEVYKHILASSIAEGHPRRSAGLYHTCVTTRKEMDEYLDRVLLIVRLQNYWLTASKSGHPLHVHLPTTYEFTTPLQNVTLEVPISNESNPWEDPIELADLLEITIQLSDLHLSAFTIKFYYPCPDRDVPWQASVRIACHFLCKVPFIFMSRAEYPYFRSVDRLMIDLGTLGAPPRSIGSIGEDVICDIILRCQFFSRGNKWWLGAGATAPNNRWTLCFDLKEGLPSLVNEAGRRWTVGRHVMSEWDKEHPDAR